MVLAMEQGAMRRAAGHILERRRNWAAREPGVVLVFCILFIVIVLLVALFITRKLQARRAARSQG